MKSLSLSPPWPHSSQYLMSLAPTNQLIQWPTIIVRILHVEIECKWRKKNSVDVVINFILIKQEVSSVFSWKRFHCLRLTYFLKEIFKTAVRKRCIKKINPKNVFKFLRVIDFINADITNEQMIKWNLPEKWKVSFLNQGSGSE